MEERKVEKEYQVEEKKEKEEEDKEDVQDVEERIMNSNR